MSEIGQKSLMRRLAQRLNIFDLKLGPAALDTGDVKVVVPLIQGCDYDEFYIQVTRGRAVDSLGEIEDPIFAVGGLSANGTSVSQFGVGASPDTAATGALLLQAMQFDYRILGVSARVVYNVPPGGTEPGHVLGVKLRYGIDQDSFVIGPTIARDNAGDGLVVNANDTTYEWAFSGTPGANIASAPWPAWIPGKRGNNGLFATLYHRSSAGQVDTWSEAATITYRTYGVRYPLGNFSW